MVLMDHWFPKKASSYNVLSLSLSLSLSLPCSLCCFGVGGCYLLDYSPKIFTSFRDTL